jgi:DNA-binding transcriptional LysR family regulator
MSVAKEKPQVESLRRLVVGSGLTIRALEVFVAVARYGTMSAAAKQLGLTQPAISQAILQIEGALDVQLFDRTMRPPVLTMQGAALLEPARNLISGVDRFQNALRWEPATQMPLLRIGMLNSFVEAVGPAVLGRLRSVAGQLIVDSGFSATRARAVTDREFDLVITTDESPPPAGIQVMPILTEPFLVVAPHSYTGDLQALKKLSESLDLIRFGRDPFMISRFDTSLRAWGVEQTHRYHMDTHAAVLQMVVSGAGWTILPPLAVFRAIARGDKLRMAPYPEHSMRRVIQLISRTGEGSVLMADLHADATEALRTDFLSVVTKMIPGVAEMITLHDAIPVTG